MSSMPLLSSVFLLSFLLHLQKKCSCFFKALIWKSFSEFCCTLTFLLGKPMLQDDLNCHTGFMHPTWIPLMCFRPLLHISGIASLSISGYLRLSVLETSCIFLQSPFILLCLPFSLLAPLSSSHAC